MFFFQKILVYIACFFACTTFTNSSVSLYAVQKASEHASKKHIKSKSKKKSSQKKSISKRRKHNSSSRSKIHTIRSIAKKHGFIWFYDTKVNPLTSFLGNFHPCNVSVAGKTFVCSEAAFQAQKFIHNPRLMHVFTTLNGPDSWSTAQRYKTSIRPDWKMVHVHAMYSALDSKFRHNPDLKAKLLATGKSYLVEHTSRDSFWGDGGDGTGQNMLGKILMGIRQNLHGHGAPKYLPKRYFAFLKKQGKHSHTAKNKKKPQKHKKNHTASSKKKK